MCGNETFCEAENSTVHGHVIIILNGEYIDLTLDQFDEYTDYIPAEPLETGGVLGTLLRKIPQYEGEIETRRINLDRLQGIYAWLRNRADAILKADPEWQAWERSIEEAREATIKVCSFLSDMQKTGVSDKAIHVSEQKNRQPMTHTGIITECYQPREVRLRETATQWVSECGLRFRKSTGAAVGSGVWSSNRLDLKSIREIQSED
ncbi:hypothetical protein [Edwardsiella piscicida]|uniref:hypothetical protein n=1 Tax=Edwardsiella piscicida TaxID=1263550 RepID=UPI00370D322F